MGSIIRVYNSIPLWAKLFAACLWGIHFLYHLSGEWSNFFIDNISLSADYNIFHDKIWSIFSYLFVHQKTTHLVLNTIFLLLVVYQFRKILPLSKGVLLLLGGSICGGFLFLLLHFFHQNDYLLGASAGIMSLLYYGTLRQYLRRARGLFHFLVILLLVSDFFGLFGENAGGHLAHLGGALWGCSVAVVEVMLHRRSILFQEDKIHREKIHQQKIALILKKIHQGGYHYLTDEEKKIINTPRKFSQYNPKQPEDSV